MAGTLSSQATDHCVLVSPGVVPPRRELKADDDDGDNDDGDDDDDDDDDDVDNDDNNDDGDVKYSTGMRRTS
jgi:hypothetical protein